MLHLLTPSSITMAKRSIFHSVYMLEVALVAALCPGPTLPGLASSCLRHMPVSIVSSSPGKEKHPAVNLHTSS